MTLTAKFNKLSTKMQARRVRDELILELDKKFKKEVVPTWLELLKSFRPYYAATGVTAKTVDNYIWCLEKHTVEWRDLSVDMITKLMIRILVSNTTKLSKTSQKDLLKCIHRVFQFAVESNYLAVNPTPVIKFKAGSKNLNVLKDSDINHLLTSARVFKSDWYYHWLIALYTGMRSGELYALTWENVDLDLKLIHVRRSWNSTDGFKSTKSGDERIVPVSPSLLVALKELKLNGEDSFVLPRLNKWTKGGQARELRKFLISINLTPIRFHDLRATWATQLLSKNVHPVNVMAIDGWKDIKTMMVSIRKAGLNLKGTTDCLDFYDPTAKTGEVYSLNSGIA